MTSINHIKNLSTTYNYDLISKGGLDTVAKRIAVAITSNKKKNLDINFSVNDISDKVLNTTYIFSQSLTRDFHNPFSNYTMALGSIGEMNVCIKHMTSLLNNKCKLYIDLSRLGFIKLNNEEIVPNSGPIAATYLIINSVSNIQETGGSVELNLPIWHPDIYRFLEIANQLEDISKVKMTVEMNLEFMESIINDDTYKLEYPDAKSHHYKNEWNGDIREWKLKDLPTNVYSEIRGKDLFKTVLSSKDIGIKFHEITKDYGDKKLLGSIAYSNTEYNFNNTQDVTMPTANLNIGMYVNEGKFDKVSFAHDVTKMISHLDSLLESEYEILKFLSTTTEIRPVGLGIMGLSDALIKMNMRYGSDESIGFIRSVMVSLVNTSLLASNALGSMLGNYPLYRSYNGHRRNSTMILFTKMDELSKILNVSNGIEPLDSLIYDSYGIDNIGKELHPLLKEAIFELDIDEDKLIDDIIDNNGSCQNIKYLPDNIKRIFLTSNDISVVDHMKVTCEVQSHLDTPVDKSITIYNFNDALIDVMIKSYLGGLRYINIKNKTTMDQSIGTNMINAETINKLYTELSSLGDATVTKIEDNSTSNTYLIDRLCGKFTFTVHREGNDIKGTSVKFDEGLCQSGLVAINNLLSFCLRKGLNPKEIAIELKGIQCTLCSNMGGSHKSCPDTIANCLLEEYEKVYIETEPKKLNDK